MSSITELDKAIGGKATAFLKLNKGISRTQVARHVGISPYSLDRIAGLGLIENYPPKMSNSQAATHGRKMGNKWGKKFLLRGSPIFGVQNAGL